MRENRTSGTVPGAPANRRPYGGGAKRNMTIRCSMTGKPMDGPADGIWDDGEWISWDWINEQLYEQELQSQYPAANLEIVRIFQELVEVSAEYKEITGRYLPVFGELGELFAEITFGIKRNKPRTQGVRRSSW
jgi:hypothetical protein